MLHFDDIVAHDGNISAGVCFGDRIFEALNANTGVGYRGFVAAGGEDKRKENNFFHGLGAGKDEFDKTDPKI